MRILVLRRSRGERGASSAEYALIATLIAVAVIGAVTLFGGATAGLFSSTCSSVDAQAMSCS